MNNTPRETVKSLIIGLAALTSLVLWLKFQPKPPADWSDLGAGEQICAGFTDASLPAELTIIRPKPNSDSDPAESAELRLAKERGEWVIRTADNAPADNTERFTMVLAPLLRLTVLSDLKEMAKESEDAVTEFHRSCRLLDPADVSSSDMKDAGIRLTVSGTEGEKYADLIIGNVPEGSSPQRDIRYIRFPGESRVFTADFSGEELEKTGEEKPLPYADRLSVEPADWMNCELLRISRWNIARMTIFDYAVSSDGKAAPKLLQTAVQDKERSLGRVWELVQFLQFGTAGKPEEIEITNENRFPDNDPLNAEAELLAHLRFSRLLRKPEGFVSLIAQNRPIQEWTEFAEQLKPYGFLFADHNPADPAGIDPFLIGTGGTVSLAMADGVKLTVLFGAESEKEQAVLVIPSLDEESFPKPELRDVPENASDLEKKSIADENRLKENEYQLNISEAEKRLELCKKRFTDWIFFIAND